VKRDYVAGYADTIDVVPIGAWFGNGRKAQKSFLSPVLLAVYDEEEDVLDCEDELCETIEIADAAGDAVVELPVSLEDAAMPVEVPSTEQDEQVLNSIEAFSHEKLVDLCSSRALQIQVRWQELRELLQEQQSAVRQPTQAAGGEPAPEKGSARPHPSDCE